MSIQNLPSISDRITIPGFAIYLASIIAVTVGLITLDLFLLILGIFLLSLGKLSSSPLLYTMSILLAVPFASERLSQTPQSLSSSQSTGLSEYEKCRLEYIGRRNLNVGSMSDSQLFEMEAGISADHPYGCGGLSKSATFEDALDNTFDNLR